MTRYFEVMRRDGPARIGKILLKYPVSTPALISNKDYISLGSIWELGSDWASKIPAIKEEKIVIMPYFPISIHMDTPFIISYPEIDLPKGIVIHPFSTDEPDDADIYVMGGAGALSNPRELVSAVTSVRDRIPPDSALYLPALADPLNLAFLIYMGVDLVDATRVIVDGYFGRYYTRNGRWSVGELSSLPCRCLHCQTYQASDDLEIREKCELLSGHNSLLLYEELLMAREMIRMGIFREYVEKQVRSLPMLTAALRLLDEKHDYLERRTPVFRNSILYSNTSESLHRIEITRFADRVINRYRAPKSEILLLLPCSARKPYSKSKSHRRISMALEQMKRHLHEVVLTSPLALVPRELEAVYPAASYDVPVTGHWDAIERKWLLERLHLYLEKNRYRTIIAHLEGELCDILKESGIDATYTGGGTGDADLERLSSAVAEAAGKTRPLEDAKRRRFLAIADYFFGLGAGDLLLRDAKIRGRELFDDSGEGIATITPQSQVALSINGARRLEEMGSYFVHIGDFLPRGDVMAPGVTDADQKIRPGDEVIVSGDMAFGVGKSRMSGWEMVESTRGVAVEIRHVERI